jgi:hypothetical protein
MSPASDEDLLARQSALQDEARRVLAELDLATLAADVGPLLVTGSFVSGLMSWRELDVMVLAGSDFSPQDVMACWPGSCGGRGSPAWTIATSGALGA